MTDVPNLSAPPAPTTGISLDTSRLTSRANLDKAGKQFEAVFTGMMLKSMREAKLSQGLGDSQQSDLYQDMFDQQMSLK